MKKILKKIDERLEEWICVIVFVAMLIVLFFSVMTRLIIHWTPPWSEEFSRYCYIALTYFSIAMATKRQSHIRIDAAIKVFPKKMRRYIAEIGDYLWLAFSVTMSYYGFVFALEMHRLHSFSTLVKVPLSLVYGMVAVGLALMAFRLIQVKIKRYMNWNKLEGEEGGTDLLNEDGSLNMDKVEGV